jgi:glycosyltransferase involved in cell wall biosynthesis
MAHPTLSVILSNYNHAEFIERALAAVLSQSFADFELLICDDASTDDSVEVIGRVTRGDPRVSLVRNAKNLGLMPNVATLLGMARGEFIHWYAADDYLLPGFFDASIASLREHPEAAFCVGSFQYLHAATGRIEPVLLRWGDRPCYLPPAGYAAAVEHHGGAAIGLTSILRRTHMDALGGFRTDLRWYSDWFLLLTLALRHGACFLPQIVGTWRLLPTAFHAAGVKDCTRQHELIGRVIDLLHGPELADLLPLVRQSGTLGDMGPYIVSALLSDPRHWNTSVARLVASGVRARVRTRVDKWLHGERAMRH